MKKSANARYAAAGQERDPWDGSSHARCGLPSGLCLRNGFLVESHTPGNLLVHPKNDEQISPGNQASRLTRGGSVRETECSFGFGSRFHSVAFPWSEDMRVASSPRISRCYVGGK